MAKFQYRMENILRIKEKIEEQKRMALGRAIGELEKERYTENLIYDKLEKSLEKFQEMMNNKMVVSEFQNMNNTINYYEMSLKEQKVLVQKAVSNVSKKRDELQLALKEKQIQEKLKEKAKEAFFEEEKLVEQKVLDEIVSFRYSSDEKDASGS